MGVNKKKKEGHVPLVIDDGGVVESSTQGMQTSMKSFLWYVKMLRLCGVVPGAHTAPYKTVGF